MSDRLSEEHRDELRAQSKLSLAICTVLGVSESRRKRITSALALIRQVRDERGWREVPVGVLNQIEAILLGTDDGKGAGEHG
jgi:hypothetical protein